MELLIVPPCSLIKTFRPAKMVKTGEELSQRFISSLRFFLILGQIFGMVSFTFAETKFCASKVLTIGIILRICTTLLLTLYMLYKMSLDDVGPVVQKTTNIIGIWCGGTLVVNVWSSNLLNRDKFIEFLLKIGYFDSQVPTRCVLEIYRKSEKQIVKFFLIKLVSLASFFFCHSFLLLQQESLIYQLTEIFTCFLVMISGMWCHESAAMVYMLKIRFITLNQQVKDLVKYYANQHLSQVGQNKNTVENSLLLGKICVLHHHLSKLVTIFNDIFGVNLLLMFGFNFIIITVALFYGSAEVQSSEKNWLVGICIFLTCLCCGIDCFYTCSVCHLTVEAVNISFIIFKL
jgi:hypothetical protein